MSYLDILAEHFLDQPNEVAIETLALCNARCTFCPYPTLERIGTKLPDELIDRLIDEMATFKKGFYFSPFKVNEPLLDKRLLPICQRFNDKVPQGGLRLFTNGSALTDETAAGIGGLRRVAHLWISLNSVDPVEYERLMGLRYEITARRLDRLHASEFPHPVVVSCVGPQPGFMEEVAQRWPRFQVAQIRQTSWLGYTDAGDNPVPAEPCSRWWELSVMADGKVSLCCMDGTGQFAIGDINTQTLLEVYNDPKWRTRRETMQDRRTVSVCQTCNY